MASEAEIIRELERASERLLSASAALQAVGELVEGSGVATAAIEAEAIRDLRPTLRLVRNVIWNELDHWGRRRDG